MSRVIGFTRSLPGDEATVEVAALKEAGATKIVTVETGAHRPIRAFLTDSTATLRAGDTVLVTRAAHLPLSHSLFIAAVAELGDRGIRFRSLAEPSLSTGGAKVPTEDVFAALDELRRELIGLRTREGLTTAALNGRRPGRPPVMTEQRLAIAHELRASGRAISHIARVLGVSPGAVRRALQVSPPH